MAEPGIGAGRLAIIAAVSLLAVGKVAYGTWLVDFPAPLFVFISFSLTAGFFLSTSRKGRGDTARTTVTTVTTLTTLAMVNVATALTFLSLFYALKLIEPAIVGAVEISIGPVMVVFIALVTRRIIPSKTSLIVCFGVFLGCAILSISAFSGSGFQPGRFDVLFGLGASSIAGTGAVLITVGSKSLLDRGWRPGAVLAHRFYVIVPLSFVLSWGLDTTGINWSAQLLSELLILSVIGVLAPLYLLQVGISRCDPYTVMVTMSVLPVLTFAFEGFSSRYEWSYMTAIGLLVITATVLWDVSARKT